MQIYIEWVKYSQNSFNIYSIFTVYVVNAIFFFLKYKNKINLE